MRSSFTYYHLEEYLPIRYSATCAQERARHEVFNFKDGNASKTTYDKLIQAVREIIGCERTNSYCVCFIPASEHYKTISRYSHLAKRIRQEIGCDCDINTITCPDHESGHLAGKSNNPTANYEVRSCDVRGKKVILIDDVITRGRTFCGSANKLLDAGASDVVGLFLAKTVNPDWKVA